MPIVYYVGLGANEGELRAVLLGTATVKKKHFSLFVAYHHASHLRLPASRFRLLAMGLFIRR
jgi:hypothetical protein